MNENDLESRIKRLELLHLYGFLIIVVAGLGYIIYKNKKQY